MTLQPADASFRAALIQMRTGRDVAANLTASEALIRQAVEGGAQYVQTPETTTLMEMKRIPLFEATQPEEGNEALAHYQMLAKDLGIWLHIGSMGIKLSEEKIANRAYLIDPAGDVVARYDKIHMFDVELPGGERYRESKNYQAGTQGVIAELPWGKLGITICYDMRFPALYRDLAMAGADFLTMPSAFTVKTGKAHWEVLLRARAIETGCYVLAAAQGGTHENGRDTYGHSMVVAPWGEVIAEGGSDPEVIFADIDRAKVEKARALMPSLQHVRPFYSVSNAAGPAMRQAS
jgi:predicted amidohydrolase